MSKKKIENIFDKKPDWRLELDTKHGQRSMLYYNGKPVGLISNLEIEIDAGSALPKIKFTTYLANVDVVLKVQ